MFRSSSKDGPTEPCRGVQRASGSNPVILIAEESEVHGVGDRAWQDFFVEIIDDAAYEEDEDSCVDSKMSRW